MSEQVDSPEQLKALVGRIILAQGNTFIKELLRNNGIRIGSTKADFEFNLIRAIEEGRLRRSQIQEWLEEVEGWGNQHIYLYRVPTALQRDAFWSDLENVRSKAESIGLGSVWGAPVSFEYPPEMILTSIAFDGDLLNFSWHQGKTWWVRDKTKDYTTEIDTDHYEFRAYRERGERAVMRFQLSLSMRLAAIFLQTPWGEIEHETAVGEAIKTASGLFPVADLELYNVSLGIRRLDQLALEDEDNEYGIRPNVSRLESGGAYVEFGTSGQRSYQDFTAVRDVRGAVKTSAFTGTKSDFLFSAAAKNHLGRNIRVTMYGTEGRVRVWVQMKAHEVWEVLRLLKVLG